MTRWLVGLAIAVVLSVDGWGCAGSAAGSGESSDAPSVTGGWCCGDLCGLGAMDATDMGETCSCDGIVRYVPDTIGECIERTPEDEQL